MKYARLAVGKGTLDRSRLFGGEKECRLAFASQAKERWQRGGGKEGIVSLEDVGKEVVEKRTIQRKEEVPETASSRISRFLDTECGGWTPVGGGGQQRRSLVNIAGMGREGTPDGERRSRRLDRGRSQFA